MAARPHSEFRRHADPPAASCRAGHGRASYRKRPVKDQDLTAAPPVSLKAKSKFFSRQNPWFSRCRSRTCPGKDATGEARDITPRPLFESVTVAPEAFNPPGTKAEHHQAQSRGRTLSRSKRQGRPHSQSNPYGSRCSCCRVRSRQGRCADSPCS